jgi:FkbM family methyltransferase
MSMLGMKSKVHRLRSGERMRIRYSDVLAPALLQEEVFEPAVRKAIEARISKGMVILDIGANIGYFTLRFSSLVGPNGRVIAFEPNPSMVAELEFNVRLNQASNVQIVPCALSENDGEAQFCFPEPGMEAHGSLMENGLFEVERRERIAVRRLDSVLREECIERVDFVKIDVEGAERLVLSGAEELLSQVPAPTFIFEGAEHLCRAFGYTLYDLLTVFESRGYSVYEADYGCWLAEKLVEGDAPSS